MNYSKYIDHTLLKPTATYDDIRKICNEAKEYNFFSVCVNPYFVAFAKNELRGTDIKIACVIGFPLGMNATAIKADEAKKAVADGANELDMVVNMGLFKAGKYDEVVKDINAICGLGADVKVIIETSELNSEEIIKMCDIVNKSDALFIKTSTGFIGDGAKLEDVKLMKEHMNANKKIKASGGIRDAKTFLDMVAAGADRIGTSSGAKIMSELVNQKAQ